MYNNSMGAEVIPKLTYEEFRRLPEDGRRYELIQGEVHLTPSPNVGHQAALRNLSSSLVNYLAKNPRGQIFFAPLDVRLSADTALQPDLIFISEARTGIIQEDFVMGPPDLVVEILSPSTAAHDRATKLQIYAEAGVNEVWLIDPRARTVEILKRQGKNYLLDVILATDRVLSSGLFPGWQLPLNDLFAFPAR